MYHANIKPKKAGVAILISDKEDFRENYQGSRGTLHNDKRINSPRRHNSAKCACT